METQKIIDLFGTNPPADPLTGLAFDKLISRLRQFGNEPAFAQQSVLRAILASFTMAVENRRAGKRIVHPTPTGAGKTTAVVCWIAALHELGRLGEISLAVSCSHVEALCGLKRDLIGMGVPPEKIGLLHSYGYKKANADLLMAGEVLNSGDWASEPSTPNRSDPLQNSERPVLLISHNRISRSQETIEYMTTAFDGAAGRRNLLIYDESLIGSTTSTCSMVKLRKGLALVKEEKYRFDPIHRQAFRYITGCYTKCHEEARRIRELKNRGIEETPKELIFPDLTTAQREDYRKAIRSLDDGINRGYLKQLTEFITMTGQALTVYAAPHQGESCIVYQPTIPEDLNPIDILDASAIIRLLPQLDRSQTFTKSIDNWKAAAGRAAEYGEQEVVDYSAVTIRRIPHGSGRTSIHDAFKAKSAERHALVPEIVDIVKTIPQDEAVLIFCHKNRSRAEMDIKELLAAELKKEGVDTAALLQDGHKRINFLTLGNETSLNRYSYVKNVIFVGLLWLDQATVSGLVKGQARDLTRNVTPKEIQDVTRSELSYRLHQGFCRGGCRIVKNGKASPMKAWFTHHNMELYPLITTAMPGVKLESHPCQHIKPRIAGNGIAASTARKILDTLKKLEAQGVQKISMDEIKKKVSAAGMAPNTFKAAAELVGKLPGSGWLKKARNLVTQAYAAGFENSQGIIRSAMRPNRS